MFVENLKKCKIRKFSYLEKSAINLLGGGGGGGGGAYNSWPCLDPLHENMNVCSFIIFSIA